MKLDRGDRVGRKSAPELTTAADLLRQRRFDEARKILEPLARTEPGLAECRRLLGLALQGTGDLEGAEREFAAGLAISRNDPALHLAFAELQVRRRRSREAENGFRSALRLDRGMARAAVGLSELLLAEGRAEEALQVTAPLLAAERPPHTVLVAHADALKALGRTAEALEIHQLAVLLNPQSGVAHHNLASALGDLARFHEAEQSARQAFAKGLDAPETWLVYARALQGRNRLDEADAAFRAAIGRRPDYADAHRDLAQLVWMRTANGAAAIETLDKALRAHPHSPDLWTVRAKVFEFAGEPRGAYETLRAAISLQPNVLSLRLAAAHAAAMAGEPEESVVHAEAAAALDPTRPEVAVALCAACLAAGRIEEADILAGKLLAVDPFDQTALAYQATAWRMLGDARHRELFDYAGLVHAWPLDTPRGWTTLESFLGDVCPKLAELHAFRTHPLEQSLRHGTQASHLQSSDDPVVRALFEAIDGPIRRHLAMLGRGDDPVRRRNLGGYRFAGAWSVQLRPGGFHTDHIHIQGWLSSACYIALPPGVADSPTREGWLKFGEPGIPTRPPLPAEHFVKPEPGLLVLFPSYMWHGTVPFGGDVPRLTAAFDIVPAPG